MATRTGQEQYKLAFDSAIRIREQDEPNSGVSRVSMQNIGISLLNTADKKL